MESKILNGLHIERCLLMSAEQDDSGIFNIISMLDRILDTNSPTIIHLYNMYFYNMWVYIIYNKQEVYWIN